jgi:hypothetical protein
VQPWLELFWLELRLQQLVQPWLELSWRVLLPLVLLLLVPPPPVSIQ